MIGVSRAAFARRVGIVLLAFMTLGSARVANATPADDNFAEYAKRVKAAEAFGALGANMFGDSINYYTGGVEFSATDVDIPGNDALPVRIARTHGTAKSEERLPRTNSIFGDWDLDVPYISGNFSTALGWQSNRCTGGLRPGYYTDSDNFQWSPEMYWRGTSIYVPGVGNQTLRSSAGVMTTPADNQTRFVTSKFWQIRCTTTLTNVAGAQEGFIALAPDGTKYTFDWMTKRVIDPVVIALGRVVSGASYRQLDRVEVRLYPTRIEDRFGNFVQYLWRDDTASGHIVLDRILSKDGRQIQLCYDSAGRAVAIGSGTITFDGSCKATGADAQHPARVWKYEYSNYNYLLRVTLPDGVSQWQYSSTESGLTGLPGFALEYDSTSGVQATCNRPGQLKNNQGKNVIIKHPSGATGVFQFSPVRRGRTEVMNNCEDPVDTGYQGWTNTGAPIATDNYALVTKQIKGPNLSNSGIQTWSMSYAFSIGCGYRSCDYQIVSDKARVTATNPDGTSTRYTFGTRHFTDEGKLYSTEVLSSTSAVLRRTDNSYRLHTAYFNPDDPHTSEASLYSAPVVQDTRDQYPYWVGDGLPGNGFPDDFADAYIVPAERTDVTQGGDAYHTAVNKFDAFARPLSVSRYNDFRTQDRLTEVTGYKDYTGATGTPTWVLGQVEHKCVASAVASPGSTQCDGLIAASTTFYDQLALPHETYAFGQLQATLAYNASDGTLTTVTDALKQSASLSGWTRGIPTAITFPDGTHASATVDENGWIKGITDENRNLTNYDYDLMGRLILVKYPAATPAWADRVLQHTLVNNAWQTRISEGNHVRTISYDERFNPVLEDDGDLAGEHRYTRRTFDYEGRATFQSYPSFSPTTTAGVFSTFDGLGRLTDRHTDAQVVLQTIAYGAGNTRTDTDANHNSTTTTYQVFGEPGYDRPISVVAPENQTTDIARDFLGKILTVTQRDRVDSTVTKTRAFAYDEYQRLCRRDDPESASTYFGYDDDNHVTWELRAQSASARTCAVQTTRANTAADAPSGANVFTYDQRGRKKLADYPGTADDITFTYYDNGTLQSVTNATAAWTYQWNNRKLVTSEQAVVDQRTYTFTRAYDTTAHLSSLTTPGRTIDFNPDAFGRPRKAGVYASGAAYHPNDLVSGYTFGNQLTFSQSIDARQRPQQINSAGLVSLQYSYDDSSNITGITDATGNGDSVSSLGYDGLHRLKAATSSLWGTYGYSFDSLNNIRGRTLNGAANLTYTYDANNLLRQVTGAQSRTYNYLDGLGVINYDTGRTFTLNALDQVKSVQGIAAYDYDGNGKRIRSTYGSDNSIEYSLYDLGGNLLYTHKVKPAAGADTTNLIPLNAMSSSTRSAVSVCELFQNTILCQTDPVGTIRHLLCQNLDPCGLPQVDPNDPVGSLTSIIEGFCAQSPVGCQPPTITINCTPITSGLPPCDLIHDPVNETMHALCRANALFCNIEPIVIDPNTLSEVLGLIEDLAQQCLNGTQACPAPTSAVQAVLQQIVTVAQNCTQGHPECPIPVVDPQPVLNALQQVEALAFDCLNGGPSCPAQVPPNERQLLKEISDWAAQCTSGTPDCSPRFLTNRLEQIRDLAQQCAAGGNGCPAPLPQPVADTLQQIQGVINYCIIQGNECVFHTLDNVQILADQCEHGYSGCPVATGPILETLDEIERLANECLSGDPACDTRPEDLLTQLVSQVCVSNPGLCDQVLVTGIGAPAAPANATPGGSSSPGPTLPSRTVSFGWDASTRASSYVLEIYDVATNTKVLTRTPSANSDSVPLAYALGAKWHVQACNSLGCSAFTSWLYFKTPSSGTLPPNVPGSPTPGTASSPGPTTPDKKVNLSWSSASSANSYSIRVTDVAQGNVVLNTTSTGTNVTASLSYATRYSWTVAACNSAGCSPGTALLYFVTPPVPAPAEVRTDYIYLAGKVIAEVKVDQGTESVTYLHSNLLGSPLAATDASGTVKWREHYDPWGMKLNNAPDEIGYTGHAYDAETGYTYMQARFYDPLVGRFLSTDPIYFSEQNPFSFNRYTYANNNPYKYTDPSGMCIESACGGSLGLEGVEGSRAHDCVSCTKETFKGELVGTIFTKHKDGFIEKKPIYANTGVEKTSLQIAQRGGGGRGSRRGGLPTESAEVLRGEVDPVSGERLLEPLVPEAAVQTFEEIIETGQAPSGQVGGRIFRNDEGLLPIGGRYREYDIHPRIPGTGRGQERIVFDEVSGRVWYTNDHYRSFTEFTRAQ